MRIPTVLIATAPVLLVVLVGATSSAVAAEPPRPKEGMEFFYENPDPARVPTLLRHLGASGQLKRSDAEPPVVGFLAALFKESPEHIESWTKPSYPFEVQRAIGIALSVAGRKDKAVEYGRLQGWSEGGIDIVSRINFELSSMRISTASRLDIMWGASSATGDPQFAVRVMNAVAGFVHAGTFPIDHMLTVSRAGTKSGQKALRRLGNMYARDDKLRMMFLGAALWGLGHYASRHAFVEGAIEARAASSPLPDMRYLLSYVLFNSRNKPVATSKGNGFEVILSMNPDDQFVDRSPGFEHPDLTMRDFRNEFRKDEPAHLALIVRQDLGIGIDVELEVASPNGDRRLAEALRFEGPNAPDQALITIRALEVEPGFLSDIGAYTVTGTFRTGQASPLIVTYRFFVRRQEPPSR